MTIKREHLAQRAQLRRNIAKKEAEQQQAARRMHISEILDQVREIIVNKEIIELLATQKIKSAPDCLFKHRHLPPQSMTHAQISDEILIFVAAWKFLFPAIGNPKIGDCLERTWPGFIIDFKDTFITLVMDGPFPGERRTPFRPTHFS
ncbi:hypothetical protein [Afipia clevelandensis]|uniref:hypothetical protein n=1 Tax=Afipia clevelandensis TaxID=1034 RepID=UPI0012F6E536|nr:hypothetical protein [Afipia clevelandensis]